MSVYLVDDDTSFLESMDMGAPKHWNLKTFSDPKYALLCLDEDSPKVIISDAQMPSLNGVEFIKIARMAIKSAHIIMISANPKEEVEKKFGVVGDDVLFYRKPLLDDFDEKIEELIRVDSDSSQNPTVKTVKTNIDRLQDIALGLIDFEKKMDQKYQGKASSFWETPDRERLELLKGNLSVSQYVLGLSDAEIENMVDGWRNQ